ncbi:gibberellin 3-beta-dioxygenase 1 [Andrographis paniculata]|uniref:gibberellin 3-beta-dioxygenase 1 n=1 Tax=Andrographis paniculata TaxID=175694 RepID=UPI0021E7311D|nr:gibberellin 3-beta-dioxygenase 1 [Andrographis paniculata]
MPSRSIAPFPNKLLDLYSIKELPETHAWGPDDHTPDDTCDDLETVPFIDLADENAPDLIGRACKTWGVFQVVNHNVSKNLLDQVEFAGNHLFSLPLHQKLRAARPPNGVAGYGVARISSFFPKLMWSEGFTIDDSLVDYARLLWPDDYQHFCDTIEAYKKEMKELAGKLMWLMLGSLGITSDDIKWGGAGAGAAVQMNSYPACPEPERAMGLAAHTDSTILTILHQSNTSGLQVLREGSGRWTTVAPAAGALVVHVGDLMHILSNGVFPSVVHRAVVNRARHRLSVAYLYGPPAHVKISPAAKVVDERRPALYRAISWSEYLGTKAKHFDKALTALRLCECECDDGFVDTNHPHNTVKLQG